MDNTDDINRGIKDSSKLASKSLIGNLTQVNLQLNSSYKFADFDIASEFKDFLGNPEKNLLDTSISDRVRHILFGIQTQRYTTSIEEFFKTISQNLNLIIRIDVKAKARASFAEIPNGMQFLYKLAGQDCINSLYINANPEITLETAVKNEIIHDYKDDIEDFEERRTDAIWRIQNISSYLSLNYKERETSNLHNIVMVPESELRVVEQIYQRKNGKDYHISKQTASLNLSAISREIDKRIYREDYFLRLNVQKMILTK